MSAAGELFRERYTKRLLEGMAIMTETLEKDMALVSFHSTGFDPLDWVDAVAAINNQATPLADVVKLYAYGRKRLDETTPVYWRHVNQAIADRWSITTLREVKRMADTGEADANAPDR